MLLHTPVYLLFLLVVAVLYWLLPRPAWRKAFLLLASYVFYALFDLRFAALLLALTLVVYWLGKEISRDIHPRRYAWLSVLLNLGVLAVFKYLNFFLGSLHSALALLGVQSLPPGLTFLLPIGLSFYTFQAISYTTEIYRRKMEPARGLADFALYLAFFPKLIAGPLVRPARFMDQLLNPAARLSSPAVQSALGLLLLGLVKKVLIADSLASMGDVAFRAAALPLGANHFSTPLYIQGFYLYAFQIYADFSGYTDIARASAALLGFSLPENFQQPYLSATISTFWNRWHMSLTQWFREYLFFPLSRSWLTATQRRHPRLVQASVTLLTMTLIGLWHGAAWTFVVWGLWHGILLVLEQVSGLKPVGRLRSFITGVITFQLVGIGWVLFGSTSLAAAGRFLAGLFSFEQMYWLPYYLPSILLTGALVFGIDLVAAQRLPLPTRLQHALRPVLVVASVVLLFSLFILSAARGGDARPFIYGRF